MSSRLPPLLAAGLLLAACGGGHDTPLDAPAPIDAETPIDAAAFPAFRNPVALPDLTLAQMAAERLGVGPREACDTCHALTRERLRSWQLETAGADQQCLTDLAPATQTAALAILDCFRTSSTTPWSPHRLGIYATGATSPWFDAVFHLAYGDDTAPWLEWSQRVSMPRGDQPPLTSDEFDVVAEWFARGLPELETVVPEIPDPPGCTQSIGPEVAAHVTAMQTEGWTALNLAAGINMLGCQGATTPGECLSAFPLSSTQAYAATWTAPAPSTTIRLLRTIGYASSYWTRSSADGRFVAHGGGAVSSATVIDLAQNREIPADAYYDPGFFPDNSGFVIQGGFKPWCRQTLLTGSPTHITFNEADCSDVSVVGLYQHLGAVAGGDYWTVNGQFVSDNAGGEPPAWFDAGSTSYLTPMVWNGSSYTARPQVAVPSPYEGDTIISPSARLLLSRVAGSGNTQNGFVLRKLVATPNGSSYDVATPEIARYCTNGGKPAFSYDERWMVFHHWVQSGDWQSLGYPDANDPAFQARLATPTANLFLLDLTTGVSRRITDMAPGQEAVFPHFRSDGWIYFVVKGATAGEVIAASDAALVFGS